jgi:hypothetical protein
MVVNNAGNMLIGTTTDAGYKLDVNGTARLNSTTLIEGPLTVNFGGVVGGTSIVANGNTIHNGGRGIYTTGYAYGIQANHTMVGNWSSQPDAAGVHGTGQIGVYGSGGIAGFSGPSAFFTSLLGDSRVSARNHTSTVQVRGSGNTSSSIALIVENLSGGTILVANNAGNVLIGTTTDAGYKLDVNGTGRFSGVVTAGINNGTFADIILDYNGGTRRIRPGGNSLALTDSLGNRAFQLNAGGANPQIAIEYDGVNFVRGLVNLGYTSSGSIQQMVLSATNYLGHLTPFFDIKATGYANSRNTDLRFYTDNTTSGTYGNIIIGHDGTTSTGNVLIGTSTNNNSRLLIGGTVSGATLSTTRATHINATLLATGNTTTLIGLDIQPTFTPGSFTGLTQLALRVSGGTQIIGSGSTGTTLSLFSVDGASGRLFDVSDDLSSTLFSVNTIAGLPVIEAFANSSVVFGKYGQNTLVVSGTSVGIGTPSPQAKLDVNGTSIFRTGVTMNSSLTLGNVDITSPWSAYTPTWTASVTNPVIGNGTITGSYTVIGKTCFVRGNIAMGSTTTFGSGEWYVSMPIPAINADAILLTATLLDNGSAWYNAIMVGARAGFNTKAPLQYVNITNGTASDVNPTQPFTWTNTDRFVWNGSYEIA